MTAAAEACHSSSCEATDRCTFSSGHSAATGRTWCRATPTRQSDPSHPSELANHDVLTYSLFSMGDQWEFTGPEGAVSVKVTPRLRTNSGNTCRIAALRHQGIVLQPTFLVGSDLLASTLVEVMPAWRSVERGVYAIYPTRKIVSPKVRLMMEFLVNAFRMRGWPA
jgi:DNA-binding transcriptional LysR family regulator